MLNICIFYRIGTYTVTKMVVCPPFQNYSGTDYEVCNHYPQVAILFVLLNIYVDNYFILLLKICYFYCSIK